MAGKADHAAAAETTIVMRKQGPGARSTYWCPQCQPLPAPATEDAGQVEGWSVQVRRKKIGCS